jgi:hypothetical protein
MHLPLRTSGLQSHIIPVMNTLSECVTSVVKKGYKDNMQVTLQGLYSAIMKKTYRPEEVSIIDFFRFEGESDPADSAILYVIETNDGDKGTLIDAYGAYSDEAINKFLLRVKEIKKK